MLIGDAAMRGCGDKVEDGGWRIEMAPRSVRLLLLAIVLLLFDLVLALESSGLGAVVFAVAVLGLILGVVGVVLKDQP